MCLTMWVTKLLLLVAVIGASNGSVVPLTEEIASAAPRNNFISYYLFTGSGPPQQFRAGAVPTAEEGFDPTAHIIIIIHDHRGHYLDEFSQSVRSAFNLHDTNFNVFVMDWTVLAGGSYSNAVRDLPIAARDLVDFMEGLALAAEDIDEENVTVTVTVSDSDSANKNVHIIGFGIGAHLAGQAGDIAQRDAEVGRITGLDPPGRSFGSNTQRLTGRSARYVEVLHTDGGPLGNGIGSAIGDVDVFINGGYNQPGCITTSCNHDRAYEVFVLSIVRGGVFGSRCSSMSQVNLNNCSGIRLSVGGYDPAKDELPGIYRANISR